MAKIISAEEAVRIVKDGDVLAVNGVATVCNPDLLCQALGKRYQDTKTPSGLTLWGATALGLSKKGAFVDSLFLDNEGLFKKAVLGQVNSTPTLAQMISENKIAGFNLPQGVVSHLYRAAAGKQPAIISGIGLNTSVDPRLDGACLNEKARNEPPLSQVVNIAEKEYLQFFTPKIDVAFIAGSIADEKGNISFENEAAFVDAIAIALATKANGGIVCIQVEQISDKRLHPKLVKIPGKAVDYIIVNPNQLQCVFEKNQPAINGDGILYSEEIVPYIERMVSFIPGNKKRYDQYIIARRAYKEINKGDIINLGVGIPGLIATIATECGDWEDITLTNEVGLIGGIPLPRPGFGASLNAEMITEMSIMFDFYDGGNLDGVYVGAAQVSSEGNVGVSKVGSVIIGVGGFINLTQSSHKVVFMTNFMDGKNMELKFEENKLRIIQEGTNRKFVNKVEQISFSGDGAIENNQDITYITERCVFKLTPEGLLLTEVAPGIDIERDILANMDFVPLIAENVKIMDHEFFDFKIQN